MLPHLGASASRMVPDIKVMYVWWNILNTNTFLIVVSKRIINIHNTMDMFLPVVFVFDMIKGVDIQKFTKKLYRLVFLR